MKRNYLVIFIILFIIFSFLQINAKTIYIIKDSEGNTVAATDQNYLTPEQTEQGYTITPLLETIESTNSSPAPNNPPVQNIKDQENVDKEIKKIDLLREINLLELSSKYINEGRAIKVNGIIKNYGEYRINDARINIECTNKSGNIAFAHVLSTNPPNIMPGEKAYFSTELDNTERIVRYKVYIFDKYLEVDYLDKLKAKAKVPNWSSSISKKGDYVCPEDRGCFYCEEDREFVFLDGTIKNVGDGYMIKTDINIIGRDFINRSVATASGIPKSLDLAPGKTVNFSGILRTNNKIIDNFVLEISWVNPQGNRSNEQTIELKN